MNQTSSHNYSHTPLVTVVIPAYNSELYIADAIKSVQKQTFKDWQLFIIDDGSTDRTASIIKQFQVNDSRITCLNQQNKGWSSARNYALKLTETPYTANLDADDMMAANRLQKQVDFLESNSDFVAIGSWYQNIDPYGLTLDVTETPESHEDIDKAHMSCHPGCLHHTTVLFRTETLRKLNGYSTIRSGSDYDLTLRIAEIGQVANIQEVLYYYRQHPESLSSTIRQVQIDNALTFCKNAHERRNISFPQHIVDEMNRPENIPSMSSLYASWAIHAVHKKQLKIARNHAFNALKHDPFKLDNWRIAKWSLTG